MLINELMLRYGEFFRGMLWFYFLFFINDLVEDIVDVKFKFVEI